MKILIACEESDTVRSRFEKLGFDAWSCDLQPNRNPNAKHYQKDIFEVINLGWDAMIAFPPCTHLSLAGTRYWKQKQKDGRQQDAIDFFMAIVAAPIKYIAIENPLGIMSKAYRKPDQIIQPYYFGDPFQKSTCLWLKNLPLLYHNPTPNLFDPIVTHTSKGEFLYWIDKKTGKQKRNPMWLYKAFRENKPGERSKIRSKTFDGIAEAMSSQWGEYLIEKNSYSLSIH
jgi:site-specific DNA-cytosine methylase